MFIRPSRRTASVLRSVQSRRYSSTPKVGWRRVFELDITTETVSHNSIPRRDRTNGRFALRVETTVGRYHTMFWRSQVGRRSREQQRQRFLGGVQRYGRRTTGDARDLYIMNVTANRVSLRGETFRAAAGHNGYSSCGRRVRPPSV